jgi:hypothetical protein
MNNRPGIGQPPDTQALSRRELLALSSLALVESGIAGAASDAPGSQELFAYVDKLYELKRQAYRTADAELFTRFHCDDLIIAGEGFPLICDGVERAAADGLLGATPRNPCASAQTSGLHAAER